MPLLREGAGKTKAISKMKSNPISGLGTKALKVKRSYANLVWRKYTFTLFHEFPCRLDSIGDIILKKKLRLLE